MFSLPYYKQPNVDSTNTSHLIYLLSTILFTVFIFLLEFYLDIRQQKKFYEKGLKLPHELTTVVSDETFKKSIEYSKDKFQFKLIESSFTFLQGLAMILLGYLPYMWDWSTNFMMAHVIRDNFTPIFIEVIITWLFIVALTLMDTLLGLPFSLYSTFVVEQKHGFNKSTYALFFQDKLMTLALTFVLSFPILGVVIWLVRTAGEFFYFYVWCFLCIVSVILMAVYPMLIAPLFNKYTKLEDGEVKTAIEDLAKKVNFPLTQLFTVDGSKRSAHSNAYFYGFFKSKRIVLYDTLLKQVTLEELLAILGHEIGHWKLWHTIQGFLISQIYTFCLFLAFSYVQHTPELFLAFGFGYSAPMPVFVGLMLFSQTFWSPVDKILTLLMTFNSRANEYAADRFADTLGMGQPLCSGLIKISVENLGNMVPDYWYSMYHYSHPPLVERLRAIQKLHPNATPPSAVDVKNKKLQ